MYTNVYNESLWSWSSQRKLLVRNGKYRCTELARIVLVRGWPGPGREIHLRRSEMNTLYLKMLVKIQNLMIREEGQDLVEYALLVALLSTGTVAAAKTLASAINTQFAAITANIT
jgi:pilus assembly protein Flp/PilA